MLNTTAVQAFGLTVRTTTYLERALAHLCYQEASGVPGVPSQWSGPSYPNCYHKEILYNPRNSE